MLLAGGAASLLAGADTAPPARGDTGLHARALPKGLFYGAAIDHTILRTDPAYMAHVPAECGMVGSETTFKWAELRPRPDQYAFERADMLTAYASRHGLQVRGHTLAWSHANPAWLEKSLTPQNGEHLLTTHIRDVVGHFRRRVVQWDVVNEVIRPEDNQVFGLADTLWFKALGPRYIDLAFHACVAADPHPLRVLNETGVEYALPWQDRRRGALLTLLADLQNRKVPVQALGIQAHLDGSQTHLDQKLLARFCADVASLGLQIVITEMDVSDRLLPADPAVRDAAVAAHGRAFLDAVLPNPQVLGVMTWGLSDRRSWLNDAKPRPDGLEQRPLPLSREFLRKPLWRAMAAGFDTAPRR